MAAEGPLVSSNTRVEREIPREATDALDGGLIQRLNVPEVARDARDLERAIESVVVRVLQERPELVFDALQSYMEREETKIIARMRAEDAHLGVDANTPHFGPLGEGPPILFFYDYTCAACAETALALGGIAYESGMTRVYLLDVAGNAEALSASRILLAARERGQNLFEALHLALLGNPVVSDTIHRMAKEIDFDSDELLAAAEVVDTQSIATARELARKWGVSELPTVVIANRKLSGPVAPDKIMEIIQKQGDGFHHMEE